jgi:polyisoprenoid-binding protein YceI
VTSTRILGLGAAVAVLAIAAFGGWYFFIRDDAPPEVNLADAIASVSTETPEAADDPTAEATTDSSVDSSDTAAASPTSDDAGSSDGGDASDGGSSAGGLVGEWAVASDSDSFVGYRVVEELARVGTTTAVGRTSDVTGTLVYDGSAITGVDIEANLRTLRSDDDRRDGQLERQALETSTFPTATFSLTEPIALDGEPADGDTIAATATGDLTLHGVTRSVVIALEGQLVGDLVVVVGSTDIQFADYDIDPPTSMAVLSVEDHGVMEFQLVFARA